MDCPQLWQGLRGGSAGPATISGGGAVDEGATGGRSADPLFVSGGGAVDEEAIGAGFAGPAAVSGIRAEVLDDDATGTEEEEEAL